jgi:hypothetical protein
MSVFIAFVSNNASAELKKMHLEKAKTSVRRNVEYDVKNWISNVGNLYLQEELSEEDKDNLFQMLESNLGIEPNGKLDLVRAWDASAELGKCNFTSAHNDGSRIYIEDKLSLIGYNYIYFELCTLYREKYASRFIKYFENGFYPNRSMFPKNEFYYKILYYYLYNVQEELIAKLNKAVNDINRGSKQPSFENDDIKKLYHAVMASVELDEFRMEGRETDEFPFSRIFSKDEQAWLNITIDYFAGHETHAALNSYEWFRAKLPLEINTCVISYNIQKTWKEQAIFYRSMLPLMLFMDKGEKTMSVEKLFDTTLKKLKLDNREVDIIVMSALKTWFLKQIRHGIRIEDRIKYSQILRELEVCPTGWIFLNLYECRSHLAELKKYADKWDGLSLSEKNSILENKMQTHFFTASDRIKLVFGDIEKIFGKDHEGKIVSDIFHRYRGEISYYFEYMQFGALGEKESDFRLPLANLKTNCLQDFKTAFIKADHKKINHINLLNAYSLLFHELLRQGRIREIRKNQIEMDELIAGRHGLGTILDNSENNLYDIYRLIAQSYLSERELSQYALQVAQKSFELGKSYYVSFAKKNGYYHDGTVGVVLKDCTEKDDFERQFEFYQNISGKLGKKLQLIMSDEDVRLYNKMKQLRDRKGNLL